MSRRYGKKIPDEMVEEKMENIKSAYENLRYLKDRIFKWPQVF